MIKNLLINTIRFYQVVISRFLPNRCRFYPCCSQYMIDAIRKFSVGKGMFLGIRRVLKCHPFHSGGVDYIEGENL